MKKLVSFKMQFLLFITLLLTILIFKNNNKNNITYLSLGDGYALGKNSYGICEYGYSDYLRDYLKDNNKLRRYINGYSENNQTIKTLKNDISNNKINVLGTQKIYLKEQLQEADFLTLSIGLNDLRYELLLEDDINYKKLDDIINRVEEDFNDLINEIKKYYKKDIYVIGYPNSYLESYYLSMAIRKYNNYLKEDDDIKYISVDDLEYDKNMYFLNSKSNYYNREGYKLIADKIYKRYKKA